MVGGQFFDTCSYFGNHFIVFKKMPAQRLFSRLGVFV